MSEEHEYAQAQTVRRPGDVYPSSAADRHSALSAAAAASPHDGALHVTQADLPAGKRLVTATAAGQVMAQFTLPVPGTEVAEETDAVTIGEALEAAASAGGRPVDLADAAALQAAETRATGMPGPVPGGVAATAQQAAAANMRRPHDDHGGGDRNATTLSDVVGSAEAALPADKVATREDADRVAATAAWNARRHGGGGGGGKGVAEAVAAAAEMNEGRMP
ncbi:late embryogenesis abundant protein 47-like [Oryza brachyantha]|uniref:late embryogenesis abundant protein 47-like n=1 Tax=Oryza brachyantha TaxID=4533 RepID=UPI001AD9D143|nr:late embryogenesis abundant protein 47-like [Oryza brachyantha]